MAGEMNTINSILLGGNILMTSHYTKYLGAIISDPDVYEEPLQHKN